MQAVLGKDMPYKDMGSLRRALRSDKDSFAYKKSHYAVRDFRQYDRWKSILGEENMPKSLAEFQDLKYNDIGHYEGLKRVNETISEIEQKTWTPVFKEKAKSEILDYKKYGIEFSAHGISRCLQRKFSKADILDMHKKPFNFVQPDGKLVKQYGLITMIYSQNGNTVVTILHANKIKEEWNEYNSKSD